MTHPSDLYAALAELSALRSNEEPIVSLYLDTRWSDEQQRERVRVFMERRIKEELARLEGHPAFEKVRRTLAKVGAFARGLYEREHDEAQQGVCLFACGDKALWRSLTFAVPFRDALALDTMPHLFQLARLLDESEPAVVVLVDSHGARLYQVAFGGVVDQAVIEGPIPRFTGETGILPRPAAGRPALAGMGSNRSNMRADGFQYEREQRNQRHRDNWIDKNLRAAGAALTELFDREEKPHIVLVGTPQTTSSFARLLPDRVQGRIACHMPRARELGTGRTDQVGELVKRAAEEVAKLEHRQESDVIDEIVGQGLRGGLAALGPEDVVLAVNEKRVHTLVIEEDFARAGWRCENCDAVGMTEGANKCPYCQGHLAWVEAFGEELVDRVLRDDGEVQVVAHSNKLHSYRGVAARLRQNHGTGLAGHQYRSTVPAGEPTAGA